MFMARIALQPKPPPRTIFARLTEKQHEAVRLHLFKTRTTAQALVVEALAEKVKGFKENA